MQVQALMWESKWLPWESERLKKRSLMGQVQLNEPQKSLSERGSSNRWHPAMYKGPSPNDKEDQVTQKRAWPDHNEGQPSDIGDLETKANHSTVWEWLGTFKTPNMTYWIMPWSASNLKPERVWEARAPTSQKSSHTLATVPQCHHVRSLDSCTLSIAFLYFLDANLLPAGWQFLQSKSSIQADSLPCNVMLNNCSDPYWFQSPDDVHLAPQAGTRQQASMWMTWCILHLFRMYSSTFNWIWLSSELQFPVSTDPMNKLHERIRDPWTMLKIRRLSSRWAERFYLLLCDMACARQRRPDCAERKQGRVQRPSSRRVKRAYLR